ncbi:MAG: helix-turn-helix domain-containing protein [Pseudomonadota bacterium]
MEPSFARRSVLTRASTLLNGLSKIVSARGQRSAASVLWWIMSLAIISSWIPESLLMGSSFAQVTAVLAGSAACGWMWLLTRTLFCEDAALTPGTLSAFGAVFVLEAAARLTHGVAIAGFQGELVRLIANAEPIACISMIALVFVAVLQNVDDQTTPAEKRFRVGYVCGLALTIFVSLVWAQDAQAHIGEATQRNALILCGLGVIVATRLAINYRHQNPLIIASSHQRKPIARRRPSAEGQVDLANRISTALGDEDFVTVEGLKVVDLAARLDVPAYKVTQCITGALGFSNFNQLLNARRIALAKSRLTDQGWQEKSISTIAYSCGFASLGTFNRSFKRLTGLTPRDYRNTLPSD